jgi:dolichol-phosphate mannosyltransferase
VDNPISYIFNDEIEIPKFNVVFENSKTSRFALVICVINEGERIQSQLKKVAAANLDIDVIICDGGSSDGTQGIVENGDFGVRVLLEKIDLGGLSSQLRIAFNYCLEKKYEYIVTMDGNNKDGIDGIYRITSALENGFDFVQGSRFIEGGAAVNTPWTRYLAIRLIHAPIISLAARRKFTDTTNGFRGFSSKLISEQKRRIFRKEFTGYELLAFFPVLASRNGYITTEVPVKRIYPRTGPVPTKIHGISGNFSLLRILLKTYFSKFDS